jgi:hypothetical protein
MVKVKHFGLCPMEVAVTKSVNNLNKDKDAAKKISIFV